MLLAGQQSLFFFQVWVRCAQFCSEASPHIWDTQHGSLIRCQGSGGLGLFYISFPSLWSRAMIKRSEIRLFKLTCSILTKALPRLMRANRWAAKVSIWSKSTQTALKAVHVISATRCLALKTIVIVGASVFIVKQRPLLKIYLRNTGRNVNRSWVSFTSFLFILWLSRSEWNWDFHGFEHNLST